ncbi:4Fe-4S domain-containing protein [Saccharothrix sp. 6-C]|uniref:4Fe-4S domain-containing protein n=1 Tax=Saccharothrix sp. 6-C TaxID=2781735 RepID=UPI001F35434D|nr:ferredoxin [Saccharothrix sp. 6-C]
MDVIAMTGLTADVLAVGYTGNDNGVRGVVALSARLSYLSLCLTLCWGVFTATGWVRRFTGHHALRSGHSMLATFTLATAAVHGFGFWFLDEQLVVGSQVVVPFLNGYVRHALGIIAFDLMVAIVVTAGMHRVFRYRNWLRFHQTAYAVFVLAAAHAWWGAWANGNFELVWLAGLTVSAPALALVAVRFVPPGALAKVGLIEGDAVRAAPVDKAAPLKVSVDNQRCHRYGFCQTEAPDVFQLQEDGRLAYRQSPDTTRNLDVLSAARSCPMRAIEVAGRDA